MHAHELARPEIRALKTYLPGSPADGDLPRVRLENNESPWSPSGAPDLLNRYPCAPRELIRRMASWYGVHSDYVMPTRGSDDAIDALVRCFCEPGRDSVTVIPPTFTMYARSAALHGAEVIEIPYGENFALPRADLLHVRDSVKLIFLCSPNNPTGRALPSDLVAALCRAYAGKAIVVVDEAYGEFMQQQSVAGLLDCYENLVVLRTLSKALALAGARVAAMLAAPEVAGVVRKTLPPYLLPSPSVAAAEAVLDKRSLAVTRQRIARLVAARDELARQLEQAPGISEVFPSDANFLLVRCDDWVRVLSRLIDAGIRVRRFDDPRLDGFLRIGIGRPSENRALIAALER